MLMFLSPVLMDWIFEENEWRQCTRGLLNSYVTCCNDDAFGVDKICHAAWLKGSDAHAFGVDDRCSRSI
ncbi:hypothetical protein HanXRQr2_Chr14g0644571 [Helianthus annuus]|uniref:Uncharacterized protein n=1 Tax=Helianthus annuus TaxID=4232 RepID=A0A251SIQ9_HELAN|nr:hypothetical protein HanXRQr2_Chr14g0644571 [Helianthus annuus]